MEELLAGAVVSPDEVYEDAAELLAPLRMIHRSLGDTGAALVADGRLTDLIRRIHCFGLCARPRRAAPPAAGCSARAVSRGGAWDRRRSPP